MIRRAIDSSGDGGGELLPNERGRNDNAQLTDLKLISQNEPAAS
jgi:hypothetical protein